MVFYTLCYYFWGQHCCLTETNILVKNFLFFVNLHFPQCLYWPLPTAASAATCVLSNSTYKLSISTDMIIEILITKLLAKFLAESHWICDTFKSYQLFHNIIDTFSAAKARKLCPWNLIIAIKHQIAVFLLFYPATNGLVALKLSLSPGAVNPRYATARSVVCFLQSVFMSVFCCCNMILQIKMLFGI